MMRKTGILDNIPMLPEDADYPEPQYLSETYFVIQFVWRETSPEKLEAFAKLHELFEIDENTTAATAREKHPEVTITDDDFTAYLVMHRPSEAPEGALASTDTDTDTGDGGGGGGVSSLEAKKKGDYSSIDYSIRSD